MSSNQRTPAKTPLTTNFQFFTKQFTIEQLKDCLALFIGVSCFYFLGFDENLSGSFSLLTRIILALIGMYCLLYFLLNKLNETFGIEGFEDPNKVYKPKVFDYAERKRKEACNLKLRGDKDAYKGQTKKKDENEKKND